MRCKYCGRETKTGAAFCSECSAKIGSDQDIIVDIPSKKQPEERKHRPWIMALVSLVIAGITTFFLMTDLQKLLFKHSTENDLYRELKAFYQDSNYNNALSELTIVNSTTVDENTFTEFQQEYQGIPVWGNSVVCITDSNGQMLGAIGNMQDVDPEISLTPTVTKENVIESIRAYAEEVYGDDISIEYSLTDDFHEIIYQYPDSSKCVLAYYVPVLSADYIVDANSGEVLESCQTMRSERIICCDANSKHPFMGYRDDNGDCVLFDTDRNILMLTANKKTYISFKINNDNGTYTTHINSNVLTPIISNDSVFGNGGDSKDTPAAYELMTCLEEIYDYYTNLGESGCGLLVGVCNDAMGGDNDNAGGGYHSIKEYLSDMPYCENLKNPGQCGIITVGTELCKSSEKNYSAIGHEYTHYIIAYHGALQSDSNESLAINEGIADIFGELVEATHTGREPDWVDGNRNAANPAEHGYPVSLNDAYTEKNGWYSIFNEQGQEIQTDYSHYFATVISHAAYLMYNGIDRNANHPFSLDDLAKFWYQLILTIPKNCSFSDLRERVDFLANTLNYTSSQKECIQAAFDTTGIKADASIVQHGSQEKANYQVVGSSQWRILDALGEPCDHYTLIVSEKRALLDITSDGSYLIGNPAANSGAKDYIVKVKSPLQLTLEKGYLYNFKFVDSVSHKSVTYIVAVTNDGQDTVELRTDFEATSNNADAEESSGATTPTVEQDSRDSANHEVRVEDAFWDYGIRDVGNVNNYRIPKIICSAKETDRTNTVIYDDLYHGVYEQIKHKSGSCGDSGITYSWASSRNIVSVLVKWMPEDFTGHGPTYFKVYNASTESGTLLDTKQVVQAYGMTLEQYYELAGAKISDYFGQMNDPLRDVDFAKEAYKKSHAEILSEENIRSALPFISENGDLCIAAKMFSVIAGEYFNALINLTGNTSPSEPVFFWSLPKNTQVETSPTEPQSLGMPNQYFIGTVTAPDAGAQSISTPQELIEQIQNNPSGSFVLTCDIDLSRFKNGNWEAISEFSGVLDGQGYAIKNLKVSANKAGLFASVSDAVFKNLGIEAVEVNGIKSAGVFAAKGSATFSNCYAICPSLSSEEAMGGLIGQGFTGALRVNDVYVDVNMSAEATAHYDGVIEEYVVNCNAGGIVGTGTVQASNLVINCNISVVGKGEPTFGEIAIGGVLGNSNEAEKITITDAEVVCKVNVKTARYISWKAFSSGRRSYKNVNVLVGGLIGTDEHSYGSGGFSYNNTVQISQCNLTVGFDLDAYGVAVAGGFIGNEQGENSSDAVVKINDCSLMGTIKVLCNDGSYAQAGGILGSHPISLYDRDTVKITNTSVECQAKAEGGYYFTNGGTISGDSSNHISTNDCRINVALDVVPTVGDAYINGNKQ